MASSYACSVFDVSELDGSHGASFQCIQGDVAFLVELSFTPEPALTVPFPFAIDDEVTLETFTDDLRPVPPSYVARRTSDGAFLFAWVEGYSLDPLGAEASWSDPTELTSVDGVCAPDDGGTEVRAIDLAVGAAEPLRVFSQHAGVLESTDGAFELRVTESSDNPDIVGGCNSCFRYALVGAPPGN